jgi:predicted esterase
MNELHFKVEKTARVFTLGEINNDTNEIVIVCHGYAMLAKYFLEDFKIIANKNRIIVAPEGLSKFYWKGMGGKVRASWMTTEDREHEIEDYINYLNKVTESYLQINPNLKITVFGFSQGTATITRWITNSNINIDRIILWAGGFPKDCLDKFKAKYPDKTIEIIIGDNDEYINIEVINKEQDYLNKNKIKHTLTKYKGTHKIDVSVLRNEFQTVDY